MILDESSHDSHCFAAKCGIGGRKEREVSSGQTGQILGEAGSEPNRTLDTTVEAHSSPTGEAKSVEPFGLAARGTTAEGRFHSYHSCQLEQIGADEITSSASLVEGLQSPKQKQEETVRVLVFLGNRIDSFNHRPRRHDPLQIEAHMGEGLYDRGLGDGVELAPLVNHQVDVGERLQTATEAALGLAHSLGNCPQLPAIGAEQDHDSVGLAKWIRAKNDSLVGADGHCCPTVTNHRPPT